VLGKVLWFVVPVVFGALPGFRRFDAWWIRIGWRGQLAFRLAVTASLTALGEWGRRGVARGS
jgi:hypothetical protein